MKEFLLVFQKDYQTDLTPQQLQIRQKDWREWLFGLAINDTLASQVKHWDKKGRVLKHDRSIIVGPYTVCEKSIESMIIIYATCYEHAKEIARGCPILELGGIVEIRMAV